MTQGKAKIWSDLPTWAKGVIAIVGVGALVFAGYKVYQLFKKDDDERQTERENKTANTAEKELKDLLAQGMKLTHPNSVYMSSATLIQNELDGCELTSAAELNVKDEVLRVVKNQADWLYLIATFGTRKIDNCGVGTGDTMYSLAPLLKEQLGRLEWNFKTIWDNLGSELTKRGVKF